MLFWMSAICSRWSASLARVSSTSASGALARKPGLSTRFASPSASFPILASCFLRRLSSLSASTMPDSGSQASRPSATTMCTVFWSARDAGAPPPSGAASMVKSAASILASVQMAAASAASAARMRSSATVSTAGIFLPSSTLYSARALRTRRTSDWSRPKSARAASSTARAPPSASGHGATMMESWPAARGSCCQSTSVT
mmetsp:Transcript_90/g.318  ORF Transcript_90/g.318 Transcript_90/m.318 type:complete len:201 (+) Transcript_90:494-1096(+)